MIKGVTHSHLGLILYHSEPSNVPYFPNQELVMNFFCRFLQQTGSKGQLISKCLFGFFKTRKKQRNVLP